MRAGRASMGPRSSDEVAQQRASTRSNQRFVNSFLCLNLFFAERRHSYVHICGFNARGERTRASGPVDHVVSRPSRAGRWLSVR